MFTNDIVPERFQGRIEVDDVFFHVTDVDADRVEMGDRLRFDVVDGDDGPRARELELVERRDGSDDSTLESRHRWQGFGHDKDGGKHGPGKETPTESDIEHFRDERKFR